MKSVKIELSYTDASGRQRIRTPKTIRNIHGLLSAVLAEFHLGLTLHTTLPQKEKKEQRILEPEQIAVLLSAVEGDVMELPDIRFHDLRHTAASVGLMLNVPMRYMMERGGWSSSQTMQHIYQHTMAAKRSEAAESVAAQRFVENKGSGLYRNNPEPMS